MAKPVKPVLTTVALGAKPREAKRAVKPVMKAKKRGTTIPQKDWVTETTTDQPEVVGPALIRGLIRLVGDDPDREGLLETPVRAMKAWKHWCSGYGKRPEDVLKVFADGAEGCGDELVLVRDIELYSTCEHHLAPFFGVAHVAYIPDQKIVGLSKLARLVDVFARRLQVQERLTNQVADAIHEHLQPKGVGVVVHARHFCMCSRGVAQQGSTTLTSALRGALRNKAAARAEFLALVREQPRNF